MNIEDHRATRLARVIEAIARHATPREAELVGLAPESAFDGLPEYIPVRNRATIEDTLGGSY
jgi:glutamate formiminotransferase